jgi:hypothetical protein
VLYTFRCSRDCQSRTRHAKARRRSLHFEQEITEESENGKQRTTDYTNCTDKH